MVPDFGLVVPLLALCAGGIGFAGVHHASIAVRRPTERVHAAFAALCMVAFFWVLWGVERYTAPGPLEYLLAERWRQSLGTAMGVFFTWFLAFYTGYRPLAFLWTLTAAQVALIAVNVALPWTISFSGLPELASVRLPWGESFVVAVGPAGPWRVPALVTQLLDFGFGFWASAHLWRRGRGREALPILIAVTLLFGALFDVWAIVIGPLPTTELAFLALIVVMSLGASRQVVEAGLIRDALADSERRLRILVETSPEAVLLLDADTGVALDANEQALELLQIEREGLDEVQPAFLSTPRQGDEGPSAVLFERRLTDTVRGGRPIFRWVVRGAEGREVPCEARMVLLPGSEPSMVRLSLVDLAELEEAESRRLDLEAQLRQAQRLEAVGRLTGGLAHDFNNFLAVMIGNLELLKEQGFRDPESSEYVEEALRAADRSRALTSRLVAFARRSPLEPHPVDFARLMRDLEPLLQRTLGDAVRVRVRLAPDLWLFLADPVQLESAVLNLAINARDALPRGGTLTVSASNREAPAALADGELPTPDNDDAVVIEVSDDGTGMSEDIVSRAVEPFFTTKMVGQGSGLGLSMVYGFVTQSGGTLTIESEEGTGTTVRLAFRRQRTSAPPT